MNCSNARSGPITPSAVAGVHQLAARLHDPPQHRREVEVNRHRPIDQLREQLVELQPATDGKDTSDDADTSGRRRP
jgi:hypothetical protein